MAHFTLTDLLGKTFQLDEIPHDDLWLICESASGMLDYDGYFPYVGRLTLDDRVLTVEITLEGEEVDFYFPTLNGGELFSLIWW